MNETLDNKNESRPRIVLVNRCFILDGKGCILLVQRSQNDSHYADLWEVPGGKLDEGQDLAHALEREVLEETGLLVEPTSRLIYADSQIISSGRYQGLPYVVLFSIGRVVGGKLKLSEEHDTYKWVEYGKALDYELTPEVRKALIVLEKHLQQI